MGSTEDVKALIGKRTQTFDAKQMTVVPGFIDAHNHAPGAILLYEVLVGNPYAGRVRDHRQHRRKAPRQSPRDARRASGSRDISSTTPRCRTSAPLNIHDLDQVSSDHPVAVRHRGGHTSYYNSKAFALAGVTKNTPNSAAGTFDRDANGELNGRVTDRARAVFNNVGMRPTYTADQTRLRNRDALTFISKQFVRYGLTSVHHEGGDLFALQQVRARGDLLHRVSYEAMDDVLEGMIKNGIATGFGDEWIRLGATSEHTCDGSFSERTMALSVPYPGVEPAYHGNVTDDAGRPQRLGRAGAPRRHPGQLPRQRGRHHRHGAHGAASGRSGCSRGPTRGPRSPIAR